MMSRYQATRWQRMTATVRYALPDIAAAVLTVAGMWMAVVMAAMLAG